MLALVGPASVRPWRRLDGVTALRGRNGHTPGPDTVAGMEALGWSDWVEHGVTAVVPDQLGREMRDAYARGNVRESTLW